ncbi:MAG TPA: Ig-like domain-containing protein, partial [Planctomycetota bacterium]|nr:Ig-like domain-containing protein [Planctomycetota bacterium]
MHRHSTHLAILAFFIGLVSSKLALAGECGPHDPPDRPSVVTGTAGPMLVGSDYEVRFDASGMRFMVRACGHEFAWQLREVRAGASTLYDASSASPPTVTAAPSGVTFARSSAISEVYQPRDHAIEQTFWIREPLPPGASLTVRGGFTSDHGEPLAVGRRLVFSTPMSDTPTAAFSYGEPILIDRRGRRTVGETRLEDDGTIALAFTADQLTGMQAPYVIDPSIGWGFEVAGSSIAQHFPAVAWNANAGEFLVVHQQTSATAGALDLRGVRVSPDGALLGEFEILDGVVAPELRPDVAFSPDSDRYAIATEGPGGSVVVTSVSATGTVLGSWPLSVSGTANASPRVIYEGYDRFAFLWTETSGGGADVQTIRSDRRHSDGSPVADDEGGDPAAFAIQQVTSTATPFGRPSIAYDGNNDQIACAVQFPDGALRTCIRSGDWKTPLGPESVSLSANGAEPSVAWEPLEAAFAVIWIETIANEYGGIDQPMLVQRIGSAPGEGLGHPLETATALVTWGAQASPCALFCAHAGELFVPRVGGYTDMLYRIDSDRYSPDGTTNLASADVGASNWAGVAHTAGATDPLTGESVVVWDSNQGQFIEAGVYEQDWHIRAQLASSLHAPANTTPTALGRRYVVAPNAAPLAIALQGFDFEGDLLHATLVTSTAHGTLSGELPRLAYQPDTGFTGADFLSFTVSD